MTWLIFFNKHAAPINHDISNKRNKDNFILKQSSPPGGTWWEFWFFYLKIRIRASLTERSRSWLANQSHVTATLPKSEANGWLVDSHVTSNKRKMLGEEWGWGLGVMFLMFCTCFLLPGDGGGCEEKKKEKKGDVFRCGRGANPLRDGHVNIRPNSRRWAYDVI